MINAKRTRQATRYRDSLALRLRLAGLSLEAIAKALGFAARSSALRAVERELAELPIHNAEELRSLELMRLDALQVAWWDLALGRAASRGRAAIAPSDSAARIVLAILDRRVKILRLTEEAEVDLEDELRELARREGLDEEDVLREAEGIIILEGQRQRGRRRGGARRP